MRVAAFMPLDCSGAILPVDGSRGLGSTQFWYSKHGRKSRVDREMFVLLNRHQNGRKGSHSLWPAI